MRMKKLTLAAALTISMLSNTAVGVFAESFTNQQLPIVTGGACPLDNSCPNVVTPDNAPCPVCKKKAKKCKCKEAIRKDDCGCRKERKKDDCCPEQRTMRDCGPMIECPQAPEPACAICPNTLSSAKDVKGHQTYAYPSAIYGTTNLVGDSCNGVALIDDGHCTACGGGIPVAKDCPTGCETGAAAHMPCLSDVTDCFNGINVDRNPMLRDGAKCPVQIHTNSSIDALKKSMVPFEMSTPTGAAATLMSVFPDVPSGFWAGCDINRLADQNVVAGYPDRTFKPNLPISRAEFASMLVKGYNLENTAVGCSKTFKDVPRNHWAYNAIERGVANGMITGYPSGHFMPKRPVSRVEAISILSKGINCPMDNCKAEEILSQYCDGKDVPSWARTSVAKALESGILKDSPAPNQISPNIDASRADTAAMLQNIRVAAGYDKRDNVAMDRCNTCQERTAYMQKEEVVKIPTLQLKVSDELSARTANVGDHFAAKTLEDITIDGVVYPCGSRVNGKVVEVTRPSRNNQGCLKLAFYEIKNGDCKANLPQQILTAQVNKCKKPNILARAIQWPFTLSGQVLGTIGRTVGGAIVNVGNAVEGVTSGVGLVASEALQGEFGASARSFMDATKTLIKAPIDVTRTAVVGTGNLFNVATEETAYLVDPNGHKVSSVNPKEKVTICFGCQGY